MRLTFPNSTRPKKAAKVVAESLNKPLAKTQNALAKSCGFSDWFDLDRNCSAVHCFDLDQKLSQTEYIARQSRLALRLAKELDVPDSDAQYALSNAHLTGDQPRTLSNQIEIRLACLRETSLPLVGKRMPGAMGKLKVAGRRGETVVLQSYNQQAGVFSVISHRAVTHIANFEYVTPKARPKLFIPRRLYLPYGFWTEVGGAKVLFSRDYMPMWRIVENREPQRLEPWLRIQKVREEWLWDDGRESPMQSEDVRQRVEGRLSEFGVTTLPIWADALPILVHNADFDSMRDALPSLRQQRTARIATAAE